MSKQVYNIDSYTFSSTDAVLFDANIWMYLYSPQGEVYPRIKNKYALAFRRIRGAKGRILLDVLVLSEFINAFSRFVYNNLPAATKPKEFKTFRNSDAFKPVAEEIAKYSLRILEKSELTEDVVELVNLRSIMRDYAAGETDFNDKMLAELCRTKDLKLVTHDYDFRGNNLTIITANERLLN
ncbi:PIN domain-containing protein [Trichocoleus sp. FACHB-90]|uniref:PIN domain-containing protein n=1 Tax=Cyanophyceae TaxID=3028117 RepID=UPI001681E5E0|nr:PIN domain-containing protein [Trichocoleus sp. FACHB-90]MBD1924804.1 PIN domain-containing protein [Trichocoleus sp. FACHB-90]